MILTITLNTSVDKFYIVKEMLPFEVSRVQEVVNTAGGKGLNVSRVAALAGESVTAAGFVGGHNGDLFQSLIHTPGIHPAFTHVAAETRCCINVRDEKTNHSTEFLEPGAPVTEEELELFMKDFLRELPTADVVTISGSMPAGVPTDFYATLVETAHSMGKPIIVDTSGQPLLEAIPAGPTLIKPNTDELHQLTGQDTSTLENCANAAVRLRDMGAKIVAVSMGKKGVLVAAEEGIYVGHTPDIPVVNTVGCGDSMVAGFAVSMARKQPLIKAIQYAVAISTANALTKETGSFRKEDLERLLPQIEVEPYLGAKS